MRVDLRWLLAAVLLLARPAQASEVAVPGLDWFACGSAPGVECARMAAPLDYRAPALGDLTLFVARSPATDPARRIGTLFVNFGGPGGAAANLLEFFGADLFPALNARYDVIGMDPRGVGQSSPSIDCKVDQEREGIYSQPFARPAGLRFAALVAKDRAYVERCAALNAAVLPHVSTANVARDMDLLRRALGEQEISYLGLSYGTFLGATYAALFPRRFRGMVLDGALNPAKYIDRPMENLREQSGGFEDALGRFLAACAADQAACLGFGGSDPRRAFDELFRSMDRNPLPTPDGRLAGGEDLLIGTSTALYSKFNWPFLAQALAQAAAGDGSLVRLLSDLSYGRRADGTFSPALDRYFTIGAVEQRYSPVPWIYLLAGTFSWVEHPHTWWNNGYVELNWGIFPISATDAFRGPFRLPPRAGTVLVVGTTHDPATPFQGAVDLAHQLGRARLLTMDGDGHTAYGGNSPCIDAAVDAYLLEGVLPAPGTVCPQEVPFAQEPAPAAARAGRPARAVWTQPRGPAIVR